MINLGSGLCRIFYEVVAAVPDSDDGGLGKYVDSGCVASLCKGDARMDRGAHSSPTVTSRGRVDLTRDVRVGCHRKLAMFLAALATVGVLLFAPTGCERAGSRCGLVVGSWSPKPLKDIASCRAKLQPWFSL